MSPILAKTSAPKRFQSQNIEKSPASYNKFLQKNVRHFFMSFINFQMFGGAKHSSHFLFAGCPSGRFWHLTQLYFFDVQIDLFVCFWTYMNISYFDIIRNYLKNVQLKFQAYLMNLGHALWGKYEIKIQIAIDRMNICSTNHYGIYVTKLL